MISSFFLLHQMDQRLKKVLRPFLDLEVERLTNNIVNKAIIDMNLSSNIEDYMIIHRNQEKLENITYRTDIMNQITNEVTKHIQDVLKSVDEGVLDDYFVSSKLKIGKYRKAKNGILCEVSLGVLRDSVLFANIGPSIPIRLSFLGQVSTEIKVETTDYGINNMMVQVILIVHVQEMVSMPISSKKKEIIIKEPLSIQMIHGDIPKYINGLSKSVK